MSIFEYIKDVKKRFGSQDKAVSTAKFESVFVDEQAPVKDPSRGTVFWTSANGKRLQNRIIMLGVVTFLVAIVFVGQLWRLQVTQGQAMAIEGEHNTLSQTPVFARRGAITDRQGKQLAWSESTSSKRYFTRSYATSTAGLGHLLGHVSYPKRDDNGNFYRTEVEGQEGVEASLQDRLAADTGAKIVETNALGEVTSESTVANPQAGDNIELTVDAGVQQKLFSLIKETATDRGFAGGAGVLMDVHSGELLAATSYPEFDPAKLTDGERGYVKSLTKNNTRPFLNRVSAGRFTPGSIVKPFMALAALEEGVITPRTEIVSTGQLRIENPYEEDTYTIFEDWDAHGAVNMREALAVSSNVYFYQIGGGHEDQPGLGIDNISRYSHAFGLGEETGIEEFSEEEGVIPTPEWKRANFDGEPWRLGDTYNTAIGQYGYQVTPLQMVRAVSGIATDGILPKPVLQRDAQTQQESVSESINSEHYQVVREGMRRAVTDGTASGLDAGFVEIAAKTGTAELGGKEAGVNSWVIGFFPYDNPRFAFTVVMADGPRSNVIGGVYVMRRLVNWMQQNRSSYLQPASSE